MVCSDWLLSAADPFPYRCELGISVLAAVCCAVLVRAQPADAVYRCVAISGAVWLAASTAARDTDVAAAALTCAVAGAWLHGRSPGARRKLRPDIARCLVCGMYGLISIASVAAFASLPVRARGAIAACATACAVPIGAGSRGCVVRCRGGWSVVAPPAAALGVTAVLVLYALGPWSALLVSSNPLIGEGIASAMPGLPTPGGMSPTPAAAIVQQWGVMGAAVLLELIAVCLVSAARVVAAPQAADSSAEFRLARAGLGVLAAAACGMCSGLPGFAGLGPSACALVTVSAAAILSAAHPEPRRACARIRLSAVAIPLLVCASGAALAYALAVCSASSRVIALDLRLRQRPPPAFVRIREISRQMQDVTLAVEDSRFYQHGAIDISAAHRALRLDVRAGRIVAGGSTITQQLAKLLFTGGSRTVLRKLREAVYAAALERTLTKRRILELYLNRVDYGRGQFGVRAAASYYFNVTPAALNLPDAALLVGIAQAPQSRGRDARAATGAMHLAIQRAQCFFPGRYSGAEVLSALALSARQVSAAPWRSKG